MSYISTILSKDRKEVIVWERHSPFEPRKVVKYPAPYYFYVTDPNGKHTTIFGTTVTKLNCKHPWKFKETRETCQKEGIEMWESDIPPEMRVLSQNYYNVPVPDLNITFLDIEVDYKTKVYDNDVQVLCRATCPTGIKEATLTVEQIRTNANIIDAVWDEEIQRWIDPKYSCYMYVGPTGFSSVRNPYAPINSISLYHRWKKEMVVLCIPPEPGWTEERLRSELNICAPHAPIDQNTTLTLKLFTNERDLLTALIKQLDPSDLVVGWNSTSFDFPMIGKRLIHHFGENALSMLTFPNAGMPYFREVEVFNNLVEVLECPGRLYGDYMQIFRKYEPGERPSFKLAAIEEEVGLDLPKLEYDGSLAKLYRKEFAYFVRYNMRDTEILNGFEDVKGYVSVANRMYHMSTAHWDHVTGTLRLHEYAIINECHHELNLIVPDIPFVATNGGIDGAFVLYPQVGLQENVFNIDIKSLYPSDIMAINISPETERGQFINVDKDMKIFIAYPNAQITGILKNGQQITQTSNEWREYLLERGWAISGYGVFYDQHQMGIIPTILEKWFNSRIEYQGLKKKYEKELSSAIDASEQHRLENLVTYYDQLQYIFKIKLNSLYGGLSNKNFRFFSWNNASGTTATGRMILQHQCRKANELMGGSYNVDFPLYNTIEDAIEAGYSHEEACEIALHGPKFNGHYEATYIAYGDTDSAYIKSNKTNIEDVIAQSDYIASEVNKSFPSFMRQTFLVRDGFDQRIKTSREHVIDRGIWVEKKRYIAHCVNTEGKTVDKMKVMGLDTKKTTLPPHVSSRINSIIEGFLKGNSWEVVTQQTIDFKDELRNAKDVRVIGLPKGVNKLEEYTLQYENIGDQARLPGHVRAALYYNMMLEQHKDKESPKLTSGMKIKVFYLQTPVGKFKSIALPTDIVEVPKWFIDEIHIDMNAHIERLVDNPMTNIVKALGKKAPNKQDQFIEDAFEF